MKKSLLVFAAGVAVMFATGCNPVTKNAQGAADSTAVAWYENDSALQADLAAAIADAKQLDTSKVRTLTPVKKGTPGQEWATIDGKDMVLVVTLVDSSRMKKFFGRDDVYRIDREMGTWVSLPADWVTHKSAFEGLDSTATHMRLLQLFGLSPDCDYDIMVSFYADPSYMFRPAHDPDITTTSVGLEFPAYADEKYKVGETNFREWYRLSVYQAYEDDSPLPWTQMGYTYDWHHGADHQGLSEYIVTHHSLIKVKSCDSVWKFIQDILKKK